VDSQRLLQIDVTSEGTIRVDGTTVPDDGVYEAVRSRLTDPENQPVVIAADRDVAFEKVVVAMDAAKRCGAKRMGVSVKHDAGGLAPEAADSKPAGGVSSKRGTDNKRRPAAGAANAPKNRIPTRPSAAKR
jgi:hypothetical protein